MADLSTVGLILGSSVSAALLTQAFSVVRDWWGKRTKRQLSALHLALELEAYGRRCSYNLSEHQNHLSSEGHAGSQPEIVPSLPAYSEAIDWNALNIETARDVCQFRVDIEQADEMVASIAEYQDGEDAYAEAMRSTAKLGLEAFRLASVTMKKSGIPQAKPSTFDPRTHLTESLQKYEQQDAEYRKSQAESHAQLMASISDNDL